MALTWDDLLGPLLPGEAAGPGREEAVRGFGEKSRWPNKLDS